MEGSSKTKRRLNVGVLFGALLGRWAAVSAGFFNGRRSAVDNANAMDQVGCGQADARASCTGLSVPFHTSAGRCCGNKVVTRRVWLGGGGGGLRQARSAVSL